MEAIAKTRHLKGSPRKARLVIDLIRGRNVSHALNILKFTDKRAADPIAKTLRSAIANATYLAEQQNIAIDPDDLFVKTCFVDMGAHKNRRRMRPAPQGRAYKEQRHYCHITILVSSDVPAQAENEKPRKKGKKLLAKEAAGAEVKTSAKETKKAKKEQPKVEKVETPVVETQETKTETVTEQVEAQEVKNNAEAADAKDTNTQNPEELNETKPADEAQLDRNEELERQ
jgi:large subunit ribosomal protein L22